MRRERPRGWRGGRKRTAGSDVEEGMTKGRGGPGGAARGGRDRWRGLAGNNGGPRLPPGAHLPPVPSEFSLRLPEESCWAPTHPPMGSPGASSATSGRSSGPAAASASSSAAAAEVRTGAPLRSPAAAQPPPPLPLHPLPWLGPFLRAHLHLSLRAASPAGLARAPPSPPARPRQAGAGPSRAGCNTGLAPSQPRSPASSRAPHHRRASARPHRPPPRGAALRTRGLGSAGPSGNRRRGRGRGRPSADWLREGPRAEQSGEGREEGGGGERGAVPEEKRGPARGAGRVPRGGGGGEGEREGRRDRELGGRSKSEKVEVARGETEFLAPARALALSLRWKSGGAGHREVLMDDAQAGRREARSQKTGGGGVLAEG